MIIVRITGGLGNQMFQYAAARSLAKDRGCSFKLDLSICYENKDKDWGYTFNRLNIIEDAASEQEISLLKNKNAKSPRKLIHRIIRNLTIKKIKHFKEVDCFAFDKMLYKTNLPIYIQGGFVSLKYFDKYRDIFLKEFLPKNDISGKNKEFAEHISSCNSVSVHIRRGDYVFDETANKKNGLLALDYYERAIDIIKSKIDDPVFFVFSNDKEWAAGNFKFDGQIAFVNHNNDEFGYEDVRLMSLCKSNIIANSTFSWWGAYLNLNPEKIVIAPQNWLAYKKTNPEEFIPKDWLVI
jgi:hypothetical protein